MHTINGKMLFAGILLFIFGSAGGGAMLYASVGEAAAINYLNAVAGILIFQIVASIWAWKNLRKNIIYVMISSIIMSINISMILIGIGVPVFFIFPIGTNLGNLLAAFLLIFYVSHIIHANIEFNEKWKANGEIAIKQATQGNDFDFHKYRDSLNLRIDILPFIPSRISLIIKISLLAGMLLGAALWTKDSPLSIIPMTVSSLCMLTFFIQVCVIAVRQINSLNRHQKRNNIFFK